MVTIEEIRAAGKRIGDHAVTTPIILSEFLSSHLGGKIYLKLENLQRTGSFKIRGAANKIECLIKERGETGLEKGVVAASAGNHAQGVALAASRLGIHATLVMPHSASLSKQLATRGYGGDVVLHGVSVGDALEKAMTYEREGMILVHPFDDPQVIAGQATVGLEIVESLDHIDEVWVPVGGGGLISGIGAALKQLSPGTRIVGVESSACAAAKTARDAGCPTPVELLPSLADGIAVASVGELTFAHMESLVDEIITVEEERIGLAILELLERKKVLVEGAGAVCLGALRARHSDNPDAFRGKTVVAVVSGGNIAMHLLNRVLEHALINTGRIHRFCVVLDDTPGALSSVLKILAESGANVLQLRHDRCSSDIRVGQAQVLFEVETRGRSHVESLVEVLASEGLRLM